MKGIEMGAASAGNLLENKKMGKRATRIPAPGFLIGFEYLLEFYVFSYVFSIVFEYFLYIFWIWHLQIEFR